jgi:DNA-binding IclR family transcriptional regulator
LKTINVPASIILVPRPEMRKMKFSLSGNGSVGSNSSVGAILPLVQVLRTLRVFQVSEPEDFPKNTARSVTARALAVLGAFSIDAPSLTLSELARRSGLPMTTVFRLAAELEEGRFLDRNSAGRYTLGIHLWEMGLLTPVHGRLRETAMPYLLNLQYECRETVQLSICDGVDGVYIEKLTSVTSAPIASRLGARMPLHATGVGKALLAFSSEAFVDVVLGMPLKRFTEDTITNKRALLKELAITRERGYSTSHQEYLLGSVSLAAPVLIDGVAVAAIGIINYTARTDLIQYVDQLREAAAGLAGRLQEVAASENT